MYRKYMKLILNNFHLRVIEISKQHGVSREYIQGQLKEAHHQVEVLEKKLQRSNTDGF